MNVNKAASVYFIKKLKKYMSNNEVYMKALQICLISNNEINIINMKGMKDYVISPI